MSREMLQWLLRQQMRFDGLIVTDAMIMQGAIARARRSGSGDSRARRRVRPAALSRAISRRWRARSSAPSATHRARRRAHPGVAAPPAQVGAVVVAAQRVSPALRHRRARGARSSPTASIARGARRAAALRRPLDVVDHRRRSRRPVPAAVARAAARFAVRRRMEGAAARALRSRVDAMMR